MRKNKIFIQEKPLIGLVTPKANKYLLKYSHFNKPKNFTNNNLFVEEKLPEQDYEIVFDCRATEEELQKCDFLDCFEIPNRQFITHKRNLEIFKKYCPDEDYLLFSVLIRHSGKKNDSFINQDFVLLWIQNSVDALSGNALVNKIDIDDNISITKITKLILKKNCMGIHKLALNSFCQKYELFHPSLAYQLRKGKNIKFYTDENGLNPYTQMNRGMKKNEIKSMASK